MLKFICGERLDGSKWVSIGSPSIGPHFQCDFYGDVGVGPVSVSDFEITPPGWVLSCLDRLSQSQPPQIKE